MAKKGIRYFETSQAAFIDMSAAPFVSEGYKNSVGEQAKPLTNVPASFTENLPVFPWSPWGTDNQFPQQMIKDIESCGILNAIIDGKARFALCEGLVPAIVERGKDGQRTVKQIVTDPEIVSFLEMNNDYFQCMGWMKDLLGFANGAVQYMLDKEYKKIVAFKRIDISELRYQKENEKNNSKIDNVYLSANWGLVSAPGSEYVRTIPLLDPNNPVADLREKTVKKVAEHALTFKYPSWGHHYYPVPMWYSAYKWVKIAQGVPEMKAALYENTMRVKYIVTIFPKYWEDAFPGQWDSFTPDQKEAKRNELFDEINNYLIGAKNAHKSLFVDGYYDQVNGKQYAGIEIKPIEDSTQQGEYLPDSAAANSEIAFSMLFNPAIIGASLPSGPYTNSQGGSNVRESVLMQIIMHEFERKTISRVMNVIKYFNGWDQTHPGLEFIIPATILTTLDTGGSSKPALMGGVKPGDNNNGINQNN
jgi:hypothetical protein